MASPARRSIILASAFLLGDAIKVFEEPSIPIVYNKVPKTGGAILQYALEEALPEALFDIIDNQYGFRDEDRQRFKIGSVRNPCDFYASLWATPENWPGSPDPQGYLPFCANSSEVLERAGVSPMKDSEQDILNFRDWLKLLSSSASERSAHCGLQPQVGIFSQAIARSYANQGYQEGSQVTDKEWCDLDESDCKNVDSALASYSMQEAVCWVHAESLMADLRQCLHVAADKLKIVVNWEKFDKAFETYPHEVKHAPCKTYFDSESEALVFKTDRHVFDKFGYKQCCAA